MSLDSGSDDLRCKRGDGLPPRDDVNTSTRVGEVQGLLKKLWGAPALEEDTLFGPLTEQAVKDFQSANSLAPTGIVDDATSNMLQNENASPIGSLPSIPLPSAKQASTAGKVLLVVGAVGGGGFGLYKLAKHFGVL